MITRDVRALLGKANPYMARQLEAAAGFCIARTHYEVTLEHLFCKLLEDGRGDLVKILRHFGVDAGALESRLLAAVEQMRFGNTGRPSFSPLLLDVIEQAYLIGSLEYGYEQIRSGTVLAAVLASAGMSPFRSYLDLLEPIRLEELKGSFAEIVAGSEEDRPATGRYGAPRPERVAQPGAKADSALAQFCIDVTQRVREGAIDPVLGRDEEIRQMVDILVRRRKNNPILVGEAGVGKTALVEGLALRIVADDVPGPLKDTRILNLDLGLLQAGAGVKGEFENRLKSVIAEINEAKAAGEKIITFIDEAHTLIGAGGPAGGGDAANLLKPALARGELRTIAATTWSEYKKYFEKDAALARRFQLVKVDEPDEVRAITMLRGVRSKFEQAHNVRILDSAVVAAVQLSQRYISGRQLPDKGVDVMDTASSRVKVGLDAKPAAMDRLERRIMYAEMALAARRRDVEGGTYKDDGEIERLESSIAAAHAELAAIAPLWEREKAAVSKVMAARSESGSPEELQAALAELAEVQGPSPLIPLEVTPDVVASVVADWTGIPVGKMVRDQAGIVLELEQQLGKRIIGQDHALAVLGERIRAARAGLGNPNAPQGVFLMVGPSGVGKTETGLALADLLYGGERFLTTVNMSEYQEAHTVSRLIGSPPGYVGYGEGGVLTEAVRQRPYSVVLLDEVEKSHADVMNLFYQVFDKGMLSDGEGREIDFKNTVLILTSNLASDTIMEMTAGGATAEDLIEGIRPVLRERFKPALLARMTIVPFFPISPENMRRIVDLKLAKVAERLAANARVTLETTPALADWVAERCTVEETGARNVDQVIAGQILPRISTEILSRMAKDEPVGTVKADVGEDGALTITFA
ncbi:MAG: type VI secretion system ATPase TssH [Thermoanaerobaculaceae bacterium]|nr:type VI secretion system ATPase TssH [Thermoanaerobaculaceae bacterium]MDI9620318.1 type VI secretion system ATPase TssH [Acidobacteriota bacterium]NLH11421.1 type VI secretion system ATPase TssH [Holophagae bacterium]HPW55793.1 type VI secretion system ATPase TssH [Thermoanaerobaculaceae bacterium]